MIAEVKEKNLVAIPTGIADTHGIRPGSQLDWQPTDKADTLVVKLLPDFGALASSLMGAGRKYLKADTDPIGMLMHDRAVEDTKRQASL